MAVNLAVVRRKFWRGSTAVRTDCAEPPSALYEIASSFTTRENLALLCEATKNLTDAQPATRSLCFNKVAKLIRSLCSTRDPYINPLGITKRGHISDARTDAQHRQPDPNAGPRMTPPL